MLNVPSDHHSGADLQTPYWAFISFVPEDLPWCDWLYFTLHGYPVPAALAVHATKYGFPLPDNISAFPDPNDPAHRPQLREALSRARYLIVVVSPYSAHAPQIDEHIRAFKRAGGEERIIALVVEGAPQSSSSLYVRSANRDWLPRWLEWRLGPDGRFKPADPTEPLVIDARPGYANLDDVMTSLMSVLLDVPREELEILEALTGGQEAPHEEAVRASLNGQVAVPVPWEGKVREGERVSGQEKRPPGKMLLGAVAVVGLGVGVAGGLSLNKWMKPEAGNMASVERMGDVSAKVPRVGTPLENAGKAQEKPEVVFTPPVSAPAGPSAPLEGMNKDSAEPPAERVEAGGRGNAPADKLSAAPGEPDTRLERETAVRIEKEALIARAEVLMSRGNFQQAAEVYELAVDAAHRFASLPGSGSGAYLDVARLCRTLGAIQTQVASAAEARRTYERGRKALQKLNLPKEYSKERRALIDDLDAGLRRLTQESD